MPLVTEPCREELEALVRHYHHLEGEYERAHPGSSAHRHLEHRLARDRERFEHLLAEYVKDKQLQSAWWEFLHHRGAEPSGPPAIRSLLFKGQSEAGSTVELGRTRASLR
jgi:hypothetical protein